MVGVFNDKNILRCASHVDTAETDRDVKNGRTLGMAETMVEKHSIQILVGLCSSCVFREIMCFSVREALQTIINHDTRNAKK